MICKELHSDLEKKKNFDLPLSKTVGLTLWKLATGADYQVIDNIFGVSEETASVIIQDVCEAIIDKFIDCYVRIPSADKIKETSIEFESISGIPQCVGVIDSMIIPVVPSSNNDRNVLTQILVDASYRIMNFHIANDDYFDEIFLKSSSLFQRGQEGTLFPDDVKTVNGIDVPYFVIASTACPLLPWIMTPYTKNKTMTDGKNLFNKKLENLQEVGHEAHKRLKGRWRCLQERNQRSDFVKLLIQACIILHNLCEKHGHIFNPDWSVSDETGVAHVEPVGDLYSDEAIHIRKAITDFINKNNTSKSACLKQEL